MVLFHVASNAETASVGRFEGTGDVRELFFAFERVVALEPSAYQRAKDILSYIDDDAINYYYDT